jgi:predicted dehydrogenase
VDSIRYLAGDAPVTGVTGQIVRDRPDPAAPRSGGFNASGGWRYGHPVETGALAVIEFAGGLRAEMFCGSLQIRGRQYQDLEVIGSTGRLWRAGDRAGNTLLMHDGGSGGYRPVPVEMAPDPGFVIRQFARMIREAAPHPLNGDSALADHEIVTAVYESARLRSRVTIPVAQDRYPLELMIEEGDP